MKKDLGITIIIPCYNVENFITKCLDSIEPQLKSIKYEIILINDCSKDNTDKIIKRYIKQTKLNIKYINNDENIGAGASRNKALKEAKYDYISFIDADDYLDDNYYEELTNLIIKEKSEVAVCDINIVYEDGTPSVIGSGCEGVLSKENIINTGLAASPCNKIIKKELLLKYPFAEGIMNEDVASIIAVVANAKKISYTSNTKYNYIQHSLSVQNSSFSLKRFDIFKSIDILNSRLKKDNNKIIDIIVYQQLFLFFIYVIPREKNIFKRSKYLRIFNKLSKKYNIRNNEYVLDDLERRGKKAKFYYNFLLGLNTKGFSLLTSIVIFMFNIFHSIKHSRFMSKKLSVIKDNIEMKDIIKAAKKQKKLPSVDKKVTVVVPNYNYEEFIFQRIYSILYQTYKIDEIIILDDCSKDNSRELIDEIVKNTKEFVNIRTIYNETNSGTAFKQWKKGFENAKCDYIWIAEADDYCDNVLLEEIMKPIVNDDEIVISYSDTAFINKVGMVQLKTIKPEIDIQNSGHWDSDFISDGVEEIKKYEFLNCTIANVSSCVFKNSDYSKFLKESGEYTQAGDWLFYTNVMKTGKIAFINSALNYYRVHGNNVTSTTKKEKHIEEIKRIHKRIDDEFKLTKRQKKLQEERIDFLNKVWRLK